MSIRYLLLERDLNDLLVEIATFDALHCKNKYCARADSLFGSAELIRELGIVVHGIATLSIQKTQKVDIMASNSVRLATSEK
jgi:hypothetical protein